MRRSVLTVITVAVLVIGSMSGDAEAQNRQTRPKRCPHCGRYHRVQKQDKNLLEQLWEAEQRKNAWLKKTFLGG